MLGVQFWVFRILQNFFVKLAKNLALFLLRSPVLTERAVHRRFVDNKMGRKVFSSAVDLSYQVVIGLKGESLRTALETGEPNSRILPQRCHGENIRHRSLSFRILTNTDLLCFIYPLDFCRDVLGQFFAQKRLLG